MTPPWEFLFNIVVWLGFCVAALAAATLVFGTLYWFVHFVKGFVLSAKNKR